MSASVAERATDDAPVSFDARIVLRPRTLDETFDLAMAYLRVWFGDFARLGVTLTVPAVALLVAARVFFEISEAWGMALALVLAPVIEDVVTVYAGSHVFGNRPTVRHALRTILPRLPRVVFSSVLVSAPLLPVLLVESEREWIIGVGAIAATFWPFLVALQVYRSEVSLLEQLTILRTSERTRILVSDRYGRALGLLLVSAVIRILGSLAVWMTIYFVVGFILQFELLAESWESWPGIVGYVVVAPYIALARMFDYVDARTRREGWDIQVRFNVIVQDAREEASR